MYIIEKQEISDDEDDDLEYERLMKQDQDLEEIDMNADLDIDDESEDDLEDFTKLKTKMDEKAAKKLAKTGVSSLERSSVAQTYKK